MPPDIFDSALSWIEVITPTGQPIDLTFHGGEPLIAGLAWYRRNLPRLRQHIGHRLKLHLQSNLWLLDETWCDLLKEYGVSVVTKQQWDKCLDIGAVAVEPLIIALKDSDNDVCRAAASALGQIGDKRAVVSLIAALKSGNWYAASALGQIGDPRAVEPLIAILKSSHGFERQEAAKALGQIGDARAVQPLIACLMACLEDRDEDCHQIIASGLIQLYQSGKLNDEHKRLILAKVDTITRSHYDHPSHNDNGISCSGFHDDEETHHDHVIGIEFPL
jgi:hypothetical protein